MKTNKRSILKEQYENKGCATRFKDKGLQMICNIPSCKLRADAKSVTADDGKEYASFPSSNKNLVGYYAFISGIPAGQESGTVKYSKNAEGKGEWLKGSDGKDYVGTFGCADLVKTQGAQMTLDQDQWWQSLLKNQPNKYYTYTVGIEKGAAANPSYTLVKLNEIPELAQMPETKQYVDVYVWMYKGESQTQDLSTAAQEFIKYYTDRGWAKGKAPEAERVLYLEKNLKTEPDGSKFFVTDYYVNKLRSTLTADEKKNEIKTIIGKAKEGYSKDSCRETIKSYYDVYRTRVPMTQSEIDEYKVVVNNCKRQYNFPFLKKELDELEYANDITVNGIKLVYRLAEKPVRENHDLRLKNLIRESLIGIKEEKKKTITEEKVIVNGRFKFIVENVSLKSKKQKNKFCGDLLSEMIYLNSQGFDRQAINEGFFDVIGSLFSNTGESILQYFKEYIGKWLVDTLTPFDPNGWVGGTIVRAIGNLPLGDIPKLTDCNFTTKLLSKSIAEEAVEQLKQRAGLEGPFYDILRNAVVESLEDTDLGQKIESALGTILCPLLSKVSGKMSDATETMKKGALSLS